MVNFFAGLMTIMDLFIILILGFVTFGFIGTEPLVAIIPGIFLILFCIFIYQDFNSIFSDKPLELLQFLRGIGMVYIIGPFLGIGILMAVIMSLANIK